MVREKKWVENSLYHEFSKQKHLRLGSFSSDFCLSYWVKSNHKCLNFVFQFIKKHEMVICLHVLQGS